MFPVGVSSRVQLITNSGQTQLVVLNMKYLKEKI